MKLNGARSGARERKPLLTIMMHLMVVRCYGHNL